MALANALFWAGYSIPQVAIGILLRYITAEFAIFTGSIVTCIAIALFGANDQKLSYCKAIMLIAGIASSPLYLCYINLIAVRLGNNAIPTYAGIFITLCALGAFGFLFLQAFLYQEYQIWQQTYYALSGLLFTLFMTYITFLKLEWTTTSINYHGINRKRTLVSCIKNKKEKKSYRSYSTDYEMSVQSKDITNDKKRTKNEYKSLLSDIVSIETDRQCMLFCLQITRNNKTTQLNVHPAVLQEDTEVNIKDVNDVSLWNSFKMAISNPFTYLIGIHLFCQFFFITTFNGLYQIQYFIVKFNWDRETAALINGTFWVSHAIFGIVIGKLSSYIKLRKVFYLFCSVFMFPSIYIVYCSSDTSMYLIIISNIFIGIGASICVLPHCIVREYNDSLGCGDIANSIVNTFGPSAGFVMQYLCGFMMDLNFNHRSNKQYIGDNRVYIEQDFNYAFIWVPIMCAISFIISIIIKETNGNKMVYPKSGCCKWFRTTQSITNCTQNNTQEHSVFSYSSI
eukprot:475256_1